MSDELAIACNLSAADLESRAEDLLPGLLKLAAERRLEESGYALRFPASALATLFQVIEAERLCCPFFRFHITVEPNEGPVWMALSGPAGTREFIEAFIAAHS